MFRRIIVYSMGERGPSRRNWVFTLYNAQEDIDRGFWSRFGTTLKYGICQLERCPRTQRLHFQGYVEFSNACRMNMLTRALPGIHVEPREGSRQQAIDYCKKEDTRVSGPYEFGDINVPNAGHRTDIDALRDAITSGKSEQYIFENHTTQYLRCQRSIRRAMNFYTRQRTVETQLTVLIGPTRVGKTTLIQTLYPNAYWKDHTKWWDGYEGNTIIVLDEFHGSIPVATMKVLTGCSTPTRVETKGGYVPFVGSKMIIIANVGIDRWWNWDNIRSPKEAILERITELLVCTGRDVIEFYFGDAIKLHINRY